MPNIQFTAYLPKALQIQKPEMPTVETPTIKPKTVSAIEQLPESTETIVKGITDNSGNYNVGNMQHIINAFEDAGISIRITSGLRSGATTSNGSRSHHSFGDAIDITPNFSNGETGDSMKTKLKNSPQLVQYLKDKGIGILDETKPEMMARTGATGAHWHIGPDKSAVSGLDVLLSKHGGLITKQQRGGYLYNPDNITLLEREPEPYQRQYVLRSEEQEFADGYAKISKKLGLNPDPNAKDHYYDYRGYFKEYGDSTDIDHFPDKYKLPGHPTFSIESKYYNPNIHTAGHGVEDELVMPVDDYDKISNDRYLMALRALDRKGYDLPELAKILAAQSIYETGWNNGNDQNNFGGYMSGGKRMSFKSPEKFWDYHLNNLTEKGPDGVNAETLKDYFDTINNTALDLSTKEKYNKYKAKHANTFIYSPDWENENYLKNLESVYKRVKKYLN